MPKESAMLFWIAGVLAAVLFVVQGMKYGFSWWVYLWLLLALANLVRAVVLAVRKHRDRKNWKRWGESKE